jgi:hypothetical protein
MHPPYFEMTFLLHPYEVLICGCAHPNETSKDPWKQGTVMPQVAGKVLLVASMVQ